MKLKTRTNQPVYYKLPVSSDIEHLSDGLLNSLKVGDVVQKKTGNQKHCYIVTYKGDGAGEGICLTYVACGYMETISYDRSGSSWVFNSKDVVEVKDVTKAQSGTIQDVLGLNSSGELVKGAVSGGTQLYKKTFNFYVQYRGDQTMMLGYLITNDSDDLTSSNFFTKLASALIISGVIGDYDALLLCVDGKIVCYNTSTGELISYSQNDFYSITDFITSKIAL